MSDKLTFLSERHLAKWLSRSPEGEGLLCDLLDPEKMPATVRVLAVVHNDRVELYAPRFVRVVERTALTCQTRDGEILADYLLAESLPPGIRRLYEPIYKRWEGSQKLVTPADSMNAAVWQDSLDLIASLGGDER